ncbi:MAG: small multi-drug export protein [Candidatus Verstraetearchaeota archaeon]|nr:small multi-drug export protein [Candidatus Verstraetearchaeota archaeon]
MSGDTIMEVLLVLLLGFLPISEVRGAIPFAHVFFRQDPVLYTLGLVAGLMGNLAVAPLVLQALDVFEKKVILKGRGPRFLRKVYRRVIDYARERARKWKKVEFAALVAFVAVPLPATGAWTGSLIAYVLGMRKRRAILSVSVGVLAAFAIVLAVVEVGSTVLKALFGLPV